MLFNHREILFSQYCVSVADLINAHIPKPVSVKNMALSKESHHWRTDCVNNLAHFLLFENFWSKIRLVMAGYIFVLVFTQIAL